jgi:acyl carrier protein
VEDVKKQVRDYVVENFLFGDTDVEFSDSDSFMEQGILDSTGILELILFLEETFGIKIEDDELVPENLDSLENIARFVKEKK